MSSAPEVGIASRDERLPLQRMLELYQHDLSDIWDQDLDLHGEYGYPLDRYWERSDCWPYLFRMAGKLAGFALVDRRVRIPGDDFWMDQGASVLAPPYRFVHRRQIRRGTDHHGLVAGAGAAIQLGRSGGAGARERPTFGVRRHP